MGWLRTVARGGRCATRGRKVRADIDAGHPSPLGLIKVKSSDPWQLKHDHQVLAYGYDLDDGMLALRVYDPNRPGRDDVRLSLSVADPWHLTAMTLLPPARPVTPSSGSLTRPRRLPSGPSEATLSDMPG